LSRIKTGSATFFFIASSGDRISTHTAVRMNGSAFFLDAGVPTAAASVLFSVSFVVIMAPVFRTVF
jgi:hypothetical protein